MVKLVFGALVGLAACVPIHSTEIATDTALESMFRHDTVANAVLYAAVPRLQGDALVVTIAEAERCVDIETPRNHRITHVERHVDLRYMTGLWVVAGLFSLAGVSSYLDPEATAEQQTKAGMPTTPDEARKSGVILMGIGGLAIGAAVINHLRASDSRRDDGVVSGRPIRKEYPCRERPTRDARVTLELANGVTRSGTTNEDGGVAFDMTEVPSMSLPRPKQTFSVAIGGAHVALQLADNEVEALWSVLAADPRSRLAQERRAAPQQTNDLRQAVCRSHDHSYGVLYGAFTCLARYVEVTELCADRTAAGIKLVAHKALRLVWERTVREPETVGEAFGTALAEMLVERAVDELLDRLVVPAASQYVQGVCDQLLQGLQLPQAPSNNVIACAAAVLQPRWIQDQCQLVGP